MQLQWEFKYMLFWRRAVPSYWARRTLYQLPEKHCWSKLRTLQSKFLSWCKQKRMSAMQMPPARSVLEFFDVGPGLFGSGSGLGWQNFELHSDLIHALCFESLSKNNRNNLDLNIETMISTQLLLHHLDLSISIFTVTPDWSYLTKKQLSVQYIRFLNQT